jgi:BspA type Leucine rich repeat region (6 copies)/Fibronectin type III domain
VRLNEGPGATALAFGGLGVGEGNSIQGNGGNGVSLSAGDYRGSYASTAIVGNTLSDNGGTAILRPDTAINVIIAPNYAFNLADYQYSRNATGITITKYKGTATTVTVPQFINGMRVTEIGNGAFESRWDITRITLPQGITRIGTDAFKACDKLISVNIPNGVREIGSGAFIWCGKLQTLNIPASVTSIPIFWTFWGCNSLTSINVDPANTKYASQDGILYNQDKTWLYWCPGGKSGDVKLAPTVKTIGYFSFENCNRITSITIPASVTLIEDGVFDKCTSLRSFYFLGNAPTVRSSFDPSVKATAYYVRGTTGWGTTLGGVPTATTPTAPTARQSITGPNMGGISWDVPSSNGGSDITGYVIQVRTSSGTVIRKDVLASDSRSYRATGLQNGVQYAFSVAAVNTAGVGVWSQAVLMTPRQPIIIIN